MHESKTKLDRLEQALWQAQPSARPPAPRPPIEVWQANLMRSVRLVAPQRSSLLDLPWLMLQRATITAVVIATLGWLAAQILLPIRDSDLAQIAWTQSVTETWNME